MAESFASLFQTLRLSIARRAFVVALLADLLTLQLPACAAVGAVRPPPGMALAFEERWQPRTPETGVYGSVTPQAMAPTPDGADPQLPWAMNKITGKWGTLRGSDGTIAGITIDIIGMGPNRWWHLDRGRLAFHAEPQTSPKGEVVGGWALLSRQTFARTGRIVVEADFAVTAAGPGGFAGLALIAGEGDYREIAIRYEDSKYFIKRNTPLRETVLARVTTRVSRLRIEYDPVTGFRYLVNKRVVGREAIDHEGADFAADPGVGLYFAGEAGVPHAASFVSGSVGPVRVWTDIPPSSGPVSPEAAPVNAPLAVP